VPGAGAASSPGRSPRAGALGAAGVPLSFSPAVAPPLPSPGREVVRTRLEEILNTGRTARWIEQSLERAGERTRAVRAPEFVQALANNAARARNHSEALVYNRLGNRSARAERSGVEGPSTPGLRSCARGDRDPKPRSKVRTCSGARVLGAADGRPRLELLEGDRVGACLVRRGARATVRPPGLFGALRLSSCVRDGPVCSLRGDALEEVGFTAPLRGPPEGPEGGAARACPRRRRRRPPLGCRSSSARRALRRAAREFAHRARPRLRPGRVARLQAGREQPTARAA
jgi:hypothetical protein